MPSSTSRTATRHSDAPSVSVSSREDEPLADHRSREFRRFRVRRPYIQNPNRGGLVLVLTRRANQSIMIGDNVVVTVLEVRGAQVRLGIVAPREIDVHREEVFRALHGLDDNHEIDVTDDEPETTGASRRHPRD